MDALDARVIAADERARPGRMSRLAVLDDVSPLLSYPGSSLAGEYLEEARLCWYAGSFVAAILMVELAFEELLRSHYRVTKGVGGALDSGVEVDRAGLAELTAAARRDALLDESEASDLNTLRRLRNPYAHTKDVTRKPLRTATTFLDQTIKVAAPKVSEGTSTEDEARNAIRLLMKLFPTLCFRLFPAI